MTQWSIDASSAKLGGNDNGYLDNARACLQGAMNHSNTAEFLMNVSGGTSQGGLIGIVGHGEPGFLSTGDGYDSATRGRYVDFRSNNTEWMPQFEVLRGRAAVITLWGCHVGAGAEGVAFLREMACATLATCIAPTGLICCDANGFSLEDGATWQVVSPSAHDPAPIAQPHKIFTVAREAWEYTRVNSRPIRLNDIAQISLSWSLGSHQPIILDNSLARALALNIDILHAAQPDCRPGAMITGKLSIDYASAQSGSGTEEFKIYNDMLIEPVSRPGTYYRGNAAFSAWLAVLKTS
jgi:hypothetical protein